MKRTKSRRTRRNRTRRNRRKMIRGGGEYKGFKNVTLDATDNEVRILNANKAIIGRFPVSGMKTGNGAFLYTVPKIGKQDWEDDDTKTLSEITAMINL